MDSIKMPFLPEETLRTQRVEVYLNDLKERLKQLRHKHDEVIQNSVDIIQEIKGVSSSLRQPSGGAEEQSEHINNIKRLIQDFESVKETAPKASSTPVGLENSVDIHKILDNFEKLNESHVLKDSLVLFKRAKESFEKIDTFFDKLANGAGSSGSGNDNLKPCRVGGVSSSLKHKIDIFNGVKDFTYCNASRSSSAVSMEDNRSSEDLDTVKADSGRNICTNSSEGGYEGDNDDSEYDLLTSKKWRKNKN